MDSWFSVYYKLEDCFSRLQTRDSTLSRAALTVLHRRPLEATSTFEHSVRLQRRDLSASQQALPRGVNPASWQPCRHSKLCGDKACANHRNAPSPCTPCRGW